MEDEAFLITAEAEGAWRYFPLISAQSLPLWLFGAPGAS